MLTLTVKDILEGNWDELDPNNDPFYIYVVRDDNTVLYIGQSVNPFERMLEHFGESWRLSGTGLSTFYKQHQDKSDSWNIDFYTLEDCEPYVIQYTSMSMNVYRSGSHVHASMNKAEKAMIWHFHPCLNTEINPDPSPLPEKYRDEWDRRPRKSVFAKD